METIQVFRNKELAGYLTLTDERTYVFAYEDTYFTNLTKPPVSLTLPKTKKVYTSEVLFPFFYNMLSEGFNRALQSRLLHIDEKDYFGLLKETANYDTIGAVTLRPWKP
jgi:serine/threonine-protein kinase HipA